MVDHLSHHTHRRARTHMHARSSCPKPVGTVAWLPDSEFPVGGALACLVVIYTVASIILQFRPGLLRLYYAYKSPEHLLFLESSQSEQRLGGQQGVPRHPYLTSSWVLRGQSLGRAPSGEVWGVGSDSAFLTSSTDGNAAGLGTTP